jgi:protocatechuate 3,4-dioxygenase beta subunit
MNREEGNQGKRAGRRTALALLGAAGAAFALRSMTARAQNRPACIVRPEQTEGPYFVDTQLARSDIRSDPATGAVPPGVPLRLAFRVSRLTAGGCAPLSDAHVELWQCDARGAYSGVRDSDFDTSGQKFLRGYQVTDANGIARFVTIYPGWYPGRTVHLHFMIRAGRPGTRREEFTSQLYFDDALSDRIFVQPPYAERGPRSIRNARDGIYRQGGSQLLLAVRERDSGLEAAFDIGLQASR